MSNNITVVSFVLARDQDVKNKPLCTAQTWTKKLSANDAVKPTFFAIDNCLNITRHLSANELSGNMTKLTPPKNDVQDNTLMMVCVVFGSLLDLGVLVGTTVGYFQKPWRNQFERAHLPSDVGGTP